MRYLKSEGKVSSGSNSKMYYPEQNSKTDTQLLPHKRREFKKTISVSFQDKTRKASTQNWEMEHLVSMSTPRANQSHTPHSLVLSERDLNLDNEVVFASETC